MQEYGVPRGGALIITLLAVKINSICKVIPPAVSYTLYVDDIQISVSSYNLSRCERLLQFTINKMSKWATENGFKFLPQKTACVPFSIRWGLSLNPTLKPHGDTISAKDEHKFLGITFDKKLTLGSHIKILKWKCFRAAHILKVLSHKSWGSDRECIMQIYNSLIHSKLDYGTIVYGSARRSALKMLGPVHHFGLCVSTGAFRTSLILSLYAESFQMSLEGKRRYLSVRYGY